MAVNAGMYMISLLLDLSRLGLSANPLSLLSPSDRSLLLLGATGTYPIDLLHRWWTLASASYLHGGILFNMVALRQIGGLVLSEYGAYRTFIVYTLTGIAGFLVSYVAGVSFTIGASASVCGLIGAALYYGKSRGGAYGNYLYKQVLGWVIAIFLFGFLVPGINNWAHGGGLASGICLGFLLAYQERRRENLIDKGLAAVCALLTAAVLGWAVASSLWYRLLG
jgi:rhomboid protease GluP